MNKILKGVLCAGLCCTLFAAAGCKKSSLDSEKRNLNLAIGALDGNFNPFFYTSQNDGEMISMTQISMLTTDENGEIVAGEDWPTAVLDYSVTMYDTKQVGTGNVTTAGSTEGRTEYKFVIKNGVKFSDGVDLTIKDVLFNMYVYLDPAYTGSATMYSTDIQGLTAYRTQNPNASDDSDSTLDEQFAAEAQARIQNLIKWTTDSAINETEPTDTQMKEDLETVKKLFREEIETDYTSVYSSWADTYKNTHHFTAAWQAYLYNEGIVSEQTRKITNGGSEKIYEDKNGNGTREDGETYYTTLDPNQEGADAGIVELQHILTELDEATTSTKVQQYMLANDCDETTALEALQREFCIELVYENYTEKSEIANVLRFWATAQTALDEFTGDARTDYFANLKEQEGGLLVSSISGIATEKVTEFNGVSLGEEHDVLKIVINGVDPKAIFNFAFVVAPLHYYSGTYNGVDYVATADQNFGVDLGNKDFYDKVLQSSEKNGLPVGAGPYSACNNKGNATMDRTQFLSNNVVYFMRNDYFETVGSGLSNAKIKYVNYKVYSDDKIMTALQTQEIDFGMPSATYTNVNEISANSSYLAQTDYPTGGYGYVGINPKFVPEYTVRQAIMKAMDTTMTVGYYGTALAEMLYRPMSTTSWVYDYAFKDGVSAYPSVEYTTSDAEIVALVEQAGYTLKNGVYTKSQIVDGMANANIGDTLKLTFTIAGDSTDHPAYTMFCAARDRLNALGFEITVSTSSLALQYLATGNLAVWAAAWSSASDPDMYQVYHKDSKATSVLNWNYTNILNNQSEWSHENEIIEELSEKIDAAREVLDKSERAPIYEECLDLVMQLAVELPTYQRHDLCVYNKTVIDSKTLVKNPSFNMGLFSKIWEINYV